LQGHELGHGVAPSLRSAAPVARSPVAEFSGCRPRGACRKRACRSAAVIALSPFGFVNPHPLRNGF